MHVVNPPLNVLGRPLETCGRTPMTGYFRDGCCRTESADRGLHTVCAVMTDAFLTFSKDQGNDLTTPWPAASFPGLKAGDRWCVCAARWLEAFTAGCAPKVDLEATDQATLRVVPLAALAECAL